MSNNYSCELTQNPTGLYDLKIKDGPAVVLGVENVTFQRAVVLIEDRMHTKRSGEG